MVDDRWVHIESMGEGEAVILLHGFGGSTYSWREALPRLAQRGYRALAIDLNGFGYTQRPREREAYSPVGQQSLVAGVMNTLGIQRAHIVGHSYGAGIAMLVAWEHPERAITLTLVDGGGVASGGPYIPDAVKPLVLFWTKHFALRERNIRSFLRSAVHRKDVVTQEVVTAYLDRLRIEGLENAFYGLSTRATSTPRVDPEKVTTPTLILWGKHDPVIPIRVGESLAARIPGAAIIRFDGSGHLPMEEEPEAFVGALVDFLTRKGW